MGTTYKLSSSLAGEKDPEALVWFYNCEDVNTIFKELIEICKSKGYKSYYWRFYNDNGKTVIDVGDWAELFYITPEIDIEHLQTDNNTVKDFLTESKPKGRSGLERLSGDYIQGYTAGILMCQEQFEKVMSGKRMSNKSIRELFTCLLRDRADFRENGNNTELWMSPDGKFFTKGGEPNG